MKSKATKDKSKTNKDKNKINQGNSNTLDKFFNIKKNTQMQQQQFNHIPKFIKIPMSSGTTPKQYPPHPVFLYPKYPEFRDYQFQISMECIRFNTLVCLPTGLGKTHIASILITNFTLWFPNGKIFFLAPTRPLVRQQRLSLKWFYQKIGHQNVFQMNGQLPASKREIFYKTKKVFFCTPQTFQNDLKQKRLNPNQIVLIIFDQAHRAVGNSSYSEIVRQMKKSQLAYRTIGLSATPGNEEQKIQQVLANLNISKMVYKDEEDKDVKKYFHTKQISPVIIQQPSIIKEAGSLLDNIILPYVKHLIGLRLVDGWILRNKTFNSGIFFVIMQTFNERKDLCERYQILYAYNSLKIIKFLTDAKKDLLQHGYETFKSKFFRKIQQINLGEVQQDQIVQQIQIKSKSKSKSKSKGKKQTKKQQKKQQKESKKSPSFFNQNLPQKFRQKLIQTQTYQRLKQLFNPKSNILSHPKLQKLKQLLQNFFRQAHQKQVHEKQKPSKVIVFTQFRATAVQIKKYLDSSNIVRSELFHGQSKTTYLQDVYTDEGQYSSSIPNVLHLNQKAQIGLIEKFKLNQINTLIATSIGEQGLDIGEVDCIVCYDGGNKSPIRTIQRFGRTGRKREGLVYILLMEGSEQNDFMKGKQKIKKMKQMLKNNAKFNYYGFNSSLLQQNSQLPIQLYSNVMMEQQRQDQLQLESKKTKKRVKSKLNTGDSQTTQNQQSKDQFSTELTQQKVIVKKQKKSTNKQKKTKKAKKIKQQQTKQCVSSEQYQNDQQSQSNFSQLKTSLNQQNTNPLQFQEENDFQKVQKSDRLMQISWQIGFIDQLYTQEQQHEKQQEYQNTQTNISKKKMQTSLKKHRQSNLLQTQITYNNSEQIIDSKAIQIISSEGIQIPNSQNSEKLFNQNTITFDQNDCYSQIMQIQTKITICNNKRQLTAQDLDSLFQDDVQDKCKDKQVIQVFHTKHLSEQKNPYQINQIINFQSSKAKTVYKTKLNQLYKEQSCDADKFYQINKNTQRKAQISQLLRQIIEEQDNQQAKNGYNQQKFNQNIEQIAVNKGYEWCFQSQNSQQNQQKSGSKQEIQTQQMYKQERDSQKQQFQQVCSLSSVSTSLLDQIIQQLQLQSFKKQQTANITTNTQTLFIFSQQKKND